jgi:2,3-dihydroxybenzoate decarboxylase
MAPKPIVIALEEHYLDAEITANSGPEARGGLLRQRLDDLGDLRLKEMDDAGIDIQVVSLAPPGSQRLNAEAAVEIVPRANDRLRDAVAQHANRFAAFAALPFQDPAAAADELERAVTRLGFKGGMLHGLLDGRFLDDKKFWPIYERAAVLDVPIYVHPATPHPKIVETYYGDYMERFPALAGPAWGYAVETATQAIRLVLSGVCDAYPGLRFILGHMGEAIPFSLWRLDEGFSRPGNQPVSFREVFSEHFYITTSGNFSTPALLCSMLELGVDRILFSVDWPFVENAPGVEWINAAPIAAEDKAKILGENARRLLKL